MLKNSQKLFSGDIVRHVFKLIAISLTARILGAESFGILILIQTYIKIIDKFVNFQSWQALIKFGSEYKNNDIDKFKDIIRICTQIDFISAVLGLFLSWILLVFISDIYKWDDRIIVFAVLYSFTILFNLEGTPTGILRLYSKYGIYAYQRIISASIQLILVLVLFFLKIEDLFFFIIIWLLTEILQHLLLFYYGWRELFSRDIKFKILYNMNFKGSKYILKFVGITNLQSSIKLGAKELDTMLVGYLFGTSAVGVFDIAKKFSFILSKITNPVYQAIYPDLSLLWVEKRLEDFKSLLMRSSFSLGFLSIFVWVFFIILGKNIIIIAVGPEYLGAYNILLWYMLGLVISIFALPLQPSVLSMNHPEVSLYSIAVSTVIYLSSIVLLSRFIGFHSIGFAFVIFYLVWSSIMLIFIIKKMKAY